MTAEGNIWFHQCQMLQLQFTRAPDDGRKHHPKPAEQFAGNRKLYKAASCLIIFDIKSHYFNADRLVS
jgi:hypothetical protein